MDQTELYEAVYFFGRMKLLNDDGSVKTLCGEDLVALGLHESVYRAVLRILTVCGLLQAKSELRELIDKIRGKHFEELYGKALNASQFFFNGISELEYEIYSRCNFSVTYAAGQEAARHIDLSGKTVLELGGNSGGFGAALKEKYPGCNYTVLDKAIPCAVGREFCATLDFIEIIEGDVFALELPPKSYDRIIMMNLLHDFDDERTLNILTACLKYLAAAGKFVIIEDILSGEYEPPEAVMHGLRLSTECRGGRQRTIAELQELFRTVGFRLDRTVRLDEVQVMALMSAN